jgi:hypothetical protein
MAMFAAGYAEKKVTPPVAIDLTGFGFYLDRRAESVLDDLKVRALCLKDSIQSVILITCDLLGFTVEFSDRIRKRIAADEKMPVRNILLACTHTHSGPATQPIPGLGRLDAAYLLQVAATITEVAAEARASMAEAKFGFHIEAVEPIGYNRRRINFEEIDHRLKVAIFRQKKTKIFLLNYACHPVTLGPTKEISADWPGALIKEIEGRGYRGLFFQGFCGDIDPVTYMNRRLGAGRKDLSLYGRILAERAFKSEEYAAFEGRAEVRAAERRIRLPLQVFPKSALERETLRAVEATKEFPGAGQVVWAWRKKVEKFHAGLSRSPWMEDVPVQALAVGGLKILGIPGEVFSGLGLKLRRKWPSLVPVGYANGNVGYLPTKEAFHTENDYACYCAPKFYAVFPFSPKIESILLRAGHELLSSL